jgi:hypothetical protein
LIDYPVWKDVPACTGIDVEIFFTEEKGNYPNLDYIKKLCNTCPVQIQCFNYAIENLVEGIWGATTKKERDKYRGKRRIVGKTVVPASVFSGINYE